MKLRKRRKFGKVTGVALMEVRIPEMKLAEKDCVVLRRVHFEIENLNNQN